MLTDFDVAACGANFKLYNIQNVLLCQNPNDDGNSDDLIIISPDSFDIKLLQQHEQRIFCVGHLNWMILVKRQPAIIMHDHKY